MAEIHLTARALDDLQDILDYSIEEWGETRAQKYLQAFEDAFKLLSHNPELLRINHSISSKFSLYNIRNHYLICDVFSGNIIVITIRHSSMNLLERLKELEPLLDEEITILQEQLRNTPD